ncbi:polysaccharide deacetylase family protein [Caenibacillus caldisaponilyticus]|uniref:polysaccharide deacetylase family protein n=1 Tax=Caenibacillus caldisaponilyticus TaxID=1674942 RepID=UPI001EE6B98B|nr:polysaccharide deacetylase family protein [Caenibacillus caldisaponilyticus]
MHFFWMIDGRKIKKLVFILIAAFFAALVAYVQNQEVAVFSTAEGPRALSKVTTNKPQIALTFDIGWGDIRLEYILDVLEKEKVKATFFISGEWADRHKDWVEKLKEEGYEIASHGMSHHPYTALEPNEMRQDMISAREAIKKAGGGIPKFLRPPEGLINERALKTADALNEQVILWSVDPQDWTNPGYDRIAEYVVKHAEKGAIIRLHASDSAKQTARALPLIIRSLRDKGYSFVTLTTLISDADIKIKLIQ